MPIQTLEQLALARKVRDHIKAHPAEHAQENWFRAGDHSCGTTACIAGWTAYFDGAELIIGLDGYVDHVETESGAGEHVADYALRALGLDRDEGEEEFFYDDNAQALEYLDKLIADGEAAVSGATR
ncbi:hypothetical protein [Nocardia vaccinii]|uniref:hypothetical protein n=1 Tax=Nocardia vaccinii TaxID=1822 RepID=UPI000835B9EA|nr:hypothetical protein [Nocardia vaccinii]